MTSRDTAHSILPANKIEILLIARTRAANRMTHSNDKDMTYLSSLASSKADTCMMAEPKDQMTHKLLYLLLEEMASTRRASKETNKLLEEMNETLKEMNKHLSRIAKGTMIINREGDIAVRSYKCN